MQKAQGGMSEKRLLEIIDLEHHFTRKGEVVPVLCQLSCTVARGELVCLIGRSGCGKSTLLSIVAGFLKPSRGQCLLNGQAIEHPGPDRCVVFQEDALFPWLTVRENITFGLGGGTQQRRQRGRAVDELLVQVGLDRAGDMLPQALSGGMKQRVALARVLIRSPQLLLMDEPFGALDAQTREAMQELLLSISQQRQQAILFVTHDVREAVALADRVLWLDESTGTIGGELQVTLKRPRDQASAELQQACGQMHQWLRRGQRT